MRDFFLQAKKENTYYPIKKTLCQAIHLTNPSEHPAMTKYNDWQLPINWSLVDWSISSAALSDVRDINLISDNDCKSCFFRLLRWLLKWNEYSAKKTMGDDGILSPWRPSLLRLMTDRSTRQHLSDARPPPEKRRWPWVLALIALGWSCVRGRLDTLKARTLEIWPCAVKTGKVTPVERLAEERTVKETIHDITLTVNHTMTTQNTSKLSERIQIISLMLVSSLPVANMSLISSVKEARKSANEEQWRRT